MGPGLRRSPGPVDRRGARAVRRPRLHRSSGSLRSAIGRAARGARAHPGAYARPGHRHRPLDLPRQHRHLDHADPRLAWRRLPGSGARAPGHAREPLRRPLHDRRQADRGGPLHPAGGRAAGVRHPGRLAQHLDPHPFRQRRRGPELEAGRKRHHQLQPAEDRALRERRLRRRLRQRPRGGRAGHARSRP